MFKTGGGTPNLLSTSLDERLAAMGALTNRTIATQIRLRLRISNCCIFRNSGFDIMNYLLLHCALRFKCSDVMLPENVVINNLKAKVLIINKWSMIQIKLGSVALEQGQEIPQKTRETLCSTPLTKAPKIKKSKRKPNASVKTAEAANARKVAMERDYEQIAQFREEEHRATMTYWQNCSIIIC
ncbi:uncharacterized protein TNCV_131811 [Trichonephila clavipes]|nr:uncharacterized protein TNCV_131811 [Trichonephila clavipes]